LFLGIVAYLGLEDISKLILSTHLPLLSFASPKESNKEKEPRPLSFKGTGCCLDRLRFFGAAGLRMATVLCRYGFVVVSWFMV